VVGVGAGAGAGRADTVVLVVGAGAAAVVVVVASSLVDDAWELPVSTSISSSVVVDRSTATPRTSESLSSPLQAAVRRKIAKGRMARRRITQWLTLRGIQVHVFSRAVTTVARVSSHDDRAPFQ
jgi:hypothetical protein